MGNSMVVTCQKCGEPIPIVQGVEGAPTIRCPNCNAVFVHPSVPKAATAPAFNSESDPTLLAKPAENPVRLEAAGLSPTVSSTQAHAQYASQIAVQQATRATREKALNRFGRAADEGSRSVDGAVTQRKGLGDGRGTAMVLSLVWPGLGQIYRGRIWAGLAWMATTFIGYLLLVIPGLLLHFCCVIAAGKPRGNSPGSARRHDRAEAKMGSRTAMVLSLLWPGLGQICRGRPGPVLAGCCWFSSSTSSA